MSNHPAPELAYEARANRGSRRGARSVRLGMWLVTGLPMCAAVLTVAGGVTALPPASANGGCIQGDIPGEVGRLTRPGDNVCVPPNIAQEVQSENAAAAQGQGYAGGGAYGPKTCISGLVWREGYDGDAVCVSPQRRQETWQENANAGVGATGGLQPQTNPPGPGRHTVTYQVLGAGDVFSVIPDPGTSVYPPSTTKWVATPWSQTVEVTGSKYLALNYTDHNGTHDCAIQVDGKPVALTEHKPGRCAYQLP